MVHCNISWAGPCHAQGEIAQPRCPTSAVRPREGRRIGDLRDPAQVIGLADSVASAGPLDILINNAAQTVRRSPGAYKPLVDAELAPLPDGPLPELLTFGHTNDAHPLALARVPTSPYRPAGSVSCGLPLAPSPSPTGRAAAAPASVSNCIANRYRREETPSPPALSSSIPAF